LRAKVTALTSDRDTNLVRIRDLIIHYDSKLNERDQLLTRAQLTIQQLTETVTAQRAQHAKLKTDTEQELAQRTAELQVECSSWKQKYLLVYNDEKNKRMENLEKEKQRLENELEKYVPMLPLRHS
jgi:hypothetical protein